tara:strand:+ start:1178 stop:1723 length:546 start_codon:yes stop_codon:yes gene_type:complete
MLIENTEINDVKVVNPLVHNDNRGYFFESYSLKIFKDNGLPTHFVQDNEVSSKKGVLRGLHYQLAFPQGKLVRAVIGTILDVAVDIRLGSPTYGRYITVELSAENKKMLYVPEGFAHGYLVLSDKSIVSYKCTNFYNPNDEYGIRWNDKNIDVDWGNNSPIISKKDDSLPFLKYQKLLPKY